MVSFPFYKYIEAISIIYPQNKDVAYLHFISKGVQSNPYKTTILGTTQTFWATFDSEHTFIKKHEWLFHCSTSTFTKQKLPIRTGERVNHRRKSVSFLTNYGMLLQALWAMNLRFIQLSFPLVTCKNWKIKCFKLSNINS